MSIISTISRNTLHKRMFSYDDADDGSGGNVHFLFPFTITFSSLEWKIRKKPQSCFLTDYIRRIDLQLVFYRTGLFSNFSISRYTSYNILLQPLLLTFSASQLISHTSRLISAFYNPRFPFFLQRHYQTVCWCKSKPESSPTYEDIYTYIL